MKILQVFNQYRFRGGEEAWVDGIAKLAGNVALIDELRFRSDDWVKGAGPSLFDQVRFMGNNPASREALRERVKSGRPDLLLFHNVIPVGSFGLYHEARALGVPVVQYIHNFRPFSPGGTLWAGTKVDPSALSGNPWPEIRAGGWQGSPLKTAVLSWHLARALDEGLFDIIHHWISPSRFMRDKFVAAGVDERKISVIPHCYTGDQLEQPLSGEADHYLYLGRLERDKGVELMLAAWSAFRGAAESPAVRLKIAGSGSLESWVVQAAAADPSVDFLGFVSGAEKSRLLATSRAVVVPSICWESLGLTAYEAYACGRPVVAARAGALEETVTEGDTGWTHGAGDLKDMVRALAAAEGAGAGERARRGGAGRAWLAENGRPDHWRAAFMDLCGRVALVRNDSVLTTGALDLGGADGETGARNVAVYLGDQNPGYDRSFGISRMTEVVLDALGSNRGIRLHVVSSLTSQQGPSGVSSRQVLPWGTRGKLVRLLTDHLHPLVHGNMVRPDLYYFPKGYLPVFDGRCHPSVVTIHDTIIQYYADRFPSWRHRLEYRYWAEMLKHTLRSADCILTVSETSRRQIIEFMERHGMAAKEITVTYEPCLYETIPQPVSPRKESHVIHLSSREPHKRTAHLVRWWREMEAEGRDLPPLHLVGALPPEVKKDVAGSALLVKRPFLRDDELQVAISTAAALILPSEIEGFGLPAIEAYYLGTPVCHVAGTSVEEVLAVATTRGRFRLDERGSFTSALDEVRGMSADEIHACGLKLRDAFASGKVAAKMEEVFKRYWQG